MGDAPIKSSSAELINAVQFENQVQDACDSLVKLIEAVVFVYSQRIFEEIKTEKLSKDASRIIVQAVMGAGIDVVNEFRKRAPDIIRAADVEEEDEDDER